MERHALPELELPSAIIDPRPFGGKHRHRRCICVRKIHQVVKDLPFDPPLTLGRVLVRIPVGPKVLSDEKTHAAAGPLRCGWLGRRRGSDHDLHLLLDLDGDRNLFLDDHLLLDHLGGGRSAGGHKAGQYGRDYQ